MTIATPQQVLDALDTIPNLTVFIDGVPTDVISVSTQHSVRQPVATARIAMNLPRPARVRANAAVMIQAGHNQYVRTLFNGRIPAWDYAMSNNGDLLTINAVGWSSLLAYRERFDLTYQGPVLVADLFDSLCSRRAVPLYRADRVTDPSGEVDIALGGNRFVDDGIVTVSASGGFVSFLGNVTEPFGYAVYDAPDGTVRQSRISGAPTGTPVVTFTEGINIIDGSLQFSIADVANYHDVHGATYEDEIGASIPIRSIPAALTSDPNIPVNGGVNYSPYQNGMLVTQQLAEIVRNVREIDMSAPTETVRWSSAGLPGVSPGDVVEIVSATLGISRRYWVMSMDTTFSPDGFVTRWEGWSGGGQALPAGIDRVEIQLQEAPFHIGDENVPWYAVPSPVGTYKRWNVTIPKRATAVNLYLWHHGTNSQLVDGASNELSVTRWRVFTPDQNPDDPDVKPVTSGTMPIDPEDYEKQLPYSTFAYNPTTWEVSNPGHWTRAAVNLSRLDEGDYVFEIVAGKSAGIDDMEGRLVVVEIYGTTEPIPIAPGEIW